MNSGSSDDFDLQSLCDAAWLAAQLPRHEPGAGNGTAPAVATMPQENPPPVELQAQAQDGARAEASLQTGQIRSVAVSGIAPGAEPLYPLTAASGGNAGAWNIAALPTLEAKAELRLALRPLLLRQPRATGSLDESATVEQFLRSGLRELTPVHELAPRRWLRLSLIAEATPSSALWTQTLDEFDQLLRGQGVFRLQRRWELRVAALPQQPAERRPQLRALDRHGRPALRWNDSVRIRFWPQEILVLASDFTSAHWHDGSLPALLQRWGTTQPLLLLQLLPQRLWLRSWTGTADAQVHAPRPAAPAAAWLSSRRAEAFALQESGLGFCVPLAALQPAGLASWVRAVTGGSAAAAIALQQRQLLNRARKAAARVRAEGAQAPQELEPAQRLNRFRSISSAPAYNLARFLAVAAPLNFPVMRWVQHALLPQSDESHLAEFFLGGLLRRADAAAADELPADAVRYEFLPGLRELLQQGLPVNHGFEVLRQVGACLKQRSKQLKDKRTAVTGGYFEQQEQMLAQDNAAFALVSKEFLALALRETPPQPVEDSTAIEPGAGSDTPPSPAAGSSVAASPADNRTESPVLELSSPAVDLQWSPDQDLLALLMPDGVALWRPSTGAAVSLSLSATYPPPLRLLWYAHNEGMKDPEQSVLVNTSVRRIARALGMNGWQPVVVERLTGEEPPEFERGPSVVLLFEDPSSIHDISKRQHEQIQRLLHKSSALCISIGPAYRDKPFFADARYYIDIASTSAGPQQLKQFAARLGDAVQWVRKMAYREWGPVYFNREGTTALCWCPNGVLVTADRNEIHIYDAAAVRSTLEAAAPVRSVAETKIAIELYQSRRWLSTDSMPSDQHSRPAILHLMPVISSQQEPYGIAWADDDGKAGVYDVPPQDGVRRGGSGLPHRLVPVDETDAWALIHNGFGVTLYRMVNGEQVITNLNLTTEGSRPTPESRGLDNDISAAWITRGLTYLVTDRGDLYSEIPTHTFTTGREISTHLQSLHKMPFPPLAVATCPSLNRFAMISPDGRVSLWAANGPRELARWRLPPHALAEGTPRMALTSNGSKLAIAIGTSIFILNFSGTSKVLGILPAPV